MALTKAEKAARWDALQTAIRYIAKAYRTRAAECNDNYAAYGADTGVIGAYNKGMHDAYTLAAEQLERWMEI